MRTGEAFQGLRLVTHFVFDKTGTLTVGKPALREIETFGASETELLGVAAAAEAASEHPLAKAVLGAALERGITPPALESFIAIPGHGVRGMLAGEEILVGNLRLLEQNDLQTEAAATRIRALEQQGRTVILVTRAKRLLGLLAFGDTLRSDAAQTIATLRKAGIRTLLMSGDNRAASQNMAALAGIDDVHAELLPQDKAALIRKLQQSSKVAMVGDGINDAPALMQADVGIAMGSGTDIAIDSADIIVLNPRLGTLLDARDVSLWSYRKMAQNVWLAIMFNGIGVPLAATGLIYPIWAMAAMAASVTAIFFNSLRGKPQLFFDAILSVGRMPQTTK